MTTHAIDHLVSDPDWTLLFDGALALSAVTLLLAIVHPRVPSWAREVAEWALGLTWTVTASVSHVLGLIVGGPDPTDHTGILAAVGGVLILLAAGRSRAERLAEAERLPS